MDVWRIHISEPGRTAGRRRTIEDLHGEEDQDVEAHDPANGKADANPHPEAVMPGAQLSQNAFHEGVVRLAWCWLFPSCCITRSLTLTSPKLLTQGENINQQAYPWGKRFREEQTRMQQESPGIALHLANEHALFVFWHVH